MYKPLLVIGLLTLSVGCSQLIRTTLISDKENTRFRLQTNDSTYWTNLGTGKIAYTTLNPPGPWCIAAKPLGYREKMHTLSEPVRNLRFTFLLEDQEPSYSDEP